MVSGFYGKLKRPVDLYKPKTDILNEKRGSIIVA